MTYRRLNPISHLIVASTVFLIAFWATGARGEPAELLFEDQFDRGIPGWTAVQPPSTYIEGPLRWHYDIISQGFREHSNVYTEGASSAPSAIAPMLINDTELEGSYTFQARITSGDDDACGLIFGYEDQDNFYRVTFSNQGRDSTFPWDGWNVDRKEAGETEHIAGDDGSDGFDPSFRFSQGQPFDVTIEIDNGNQLTITVVDAPESEATEHQLVQGLTLPSDASGQPGLMVWGMSGGTPRGVVFSDLSTSPDPLENNPPQPLPEWSPIIPERQDGSTELGAGNGGRPLWSLALGSEGPYGTLHEASDAFGGNDEQGVVDFTGPSLVAGDEAWGNYVATTRIIPGDDDGQGLLVRYQDPSNFYRIALRAQSSGTGVPQGLSVQKVVDGDWQSVFQESEPQFVPDPGTPYDLMAAINGNELQVVLMADPEGAAEAYSYGPWEIQGDQIDQGKVGVFSWAMARTEFDFVRVESIDGTPLLVASPYGSPTPAAGLHSFPSGESIDASVEPVVDESPGVRRRATGWTGFGSVPDSGEEASVAFPIDSFSLIGWQWQTEYNVELNSEGNGTIQGLEEEWVAAGTDVSLTATPDEGHLFAGWSGKSRSLESGLELTVDRPVDLTARFVADSDDDQLPDEWEQDYFGNLDATAEGDNDGDGSTNSREHRLGTNPTTAETALSITTLSSPWENVQRDPLLSGNFRINDFGDGYRGPWETSNDFRGADDPARIGEDNLVEFVSFDGPRLVLRESVWDENWSDFTGEVVLTVGDNDGNCVYFRYQDESNWYRVTITGEENDAGWRAPFGVSVQKRVDGDFAEIAREPTIATDPADDSWFKRIRVTVTADGADFEVRVIGWNAFSTPAEWLDSSERTIAFQDDSLSTGRFGIGTWGQGGGDTATDEIPVTGGTLFESVRILVDDNEVFADDWADAPLPDEIPQGWENAFDESSDLFGSWEVSAHGTLVERSNAGGSTSASELSPAADTEGPILLAPEVDTQDYHRRLRLHPFDNDGIGLVYNYTDPDNYSRVMFVAEEGGVGRMPQGVTISRKANGEWSDVVVGDPAFVFEPGTPFQVRFSSNNGTYRMQVSASDEESESRVWEWDGPTTQNGARFGIATWGSTDAHFREGQAFALADRDGDGGLAIADVAVTDGRVVLEIDNPEGSAYDVERTTDIANGPWETVDTGVTDSQWQGSLPEGVPAVFWRLAQ